MQCGYKRAAFEPYAGQHAPYGLLENFTRPSVINKSMYIPFRVGEPSRGPFVWVSPIQQCAKEPEDQLP